MRYGKSSVLVRPMSDPNSLQLGNIRTHYPPPGQVRHRLLSDRSIWKKELPVYSRLSTDRTYPFAPLEELPAPLPMMAIVLGASFISRRVSLHVMAELSRRGNTVAVSGVTKGSTPFVFFSSTVDAAPMARIRLRIIVSAHR